MSVALITGASSGVGAALARRLAAGGATVAALSRRPGVSADPRIVPFAADVRDRGAIADAVDRIERDLGPIDVLVNNAAVFDRHAFVDQDEATIRAILDTGLTGTIWCSHAVVPRMRARKRGRIVNVASVAGTHGMALQAVYCAAKHGVVGFGSALAQEVVGDGILVSTICPGGIDTPLWGGENPYPGDRATLMAAEEVVDLIQFVLTRPAGSLYKTVTCFPVSEWH